MKSFLIFTVSLLFMNIKAQFTYPESQKENVSDTYFETEVSDPYRWLEDDLSTQTANWVKSQNRFTENYLEKIPFREVIREELNEFLDYEKVTIPFDKGGITYYFKNKGLDAQPILYRINEKGEEEVFLDPNTFSKDGTASLGSVSFSKDASLVAYTVSRGGSDWRDLYIMETRTKMNREDSIKNIKFSHIAWQGNDFIFYSTYPSVKGSLLSTQTKNHKLFRHRIGDKQESDIVVFGDDNDPKRYVYGDVSHDEHYLLVRASNTTNGNELYCFDLSEGEFKPMVLQGHENANTYYLFNEGKMFYLVTDKDAPNRKVVKMDLNLHNREENWYDFIKENKYVMSPSFVGDKIFIKYMVHAQDELVVYGKDGSLLYQLDAPGIGSISGFNDNPEATHTYYSFENYVTPTRIYKYDIKNNTSERINQLNVDFEPSEYKSEQVFYVTDDGVEIPMIISYKKGIKLNGKNPTILYGYGGFNISMQARFSAMVAYWLKKGGIFAVPNIRGGGEYGSQWHLAGTQLNKKNVFHDFIAAANYLKNQHYTSTDYLAIRGGSNGGLLVGATMTMQPNLCAVALPAVGVLDMLRYHKFTSGAGWAYDYGTSEDSQEMFEYLYSYSPLHSINKNRCYPATFITTGDHDDRVVPAHSFKFAAQLQAMQSCNQPTLIRVATDAGHGAGKSIAQIIDEYTDMYSFTFYNLPNQEFPKK